METGSANEARLCELAAYYSEKTRRILEKYGPGPRIHYHTGICDGSHRAGAGLCELSAAMGRAQELVVENLAQAIRPSLPKSRPARVLDVGCGLGGGAIYLSQALGAEVTGITIVAEHARLARNLAARAGVAHRVEFLEIDAHALPGEGLFDAAWALESSCYLDRLSWLRRMSRLLRPGAELHVFDWMRGNDEAAASRADEHWRTRMGRPPEYRTAAEASGLELVSEDCLNEETAGFWVLAREWDLVAMRRPSQSPETLARLERSALAIASLESAFRTRGVLSVHMVFRRRGR